MSKHADAIRQFFGCSHSFPVSVCVAAAGGVVDHSDVHSKDAWQRFNKQVMQGDAFVHFELAPQHTS